MKNLNNFYKILNVDTPVEEYIPLINVPLVNNIRLSNRIFSYLKKNHTLKYKIQTTRSTLEVMDLGLKTRPNLLFFLNVLERTKEITEIKILRLRGYMDENLDHFTTMVGELDKLGVRIELLSHYKNDSENGRIISQFNSIPKSYYLKGYK